MRRALNEGRESDAEIGPGFIVVACVGVLSTTAYAQSRRLRASSETRRGSPARRDRRSCKPGVDREKFGRPSAMEPARYRIIDLRPRDLYGHIHVAWICNCEKEKGLCRRPTSVSTVNAELEDRRALRKRSTWPRESDCRRPDYKDRQNTRSQFDSEHSDGQRGYAAVSVVDSLHDSVGRR
jgi:hypothetical protein